MNWISKCGLVWYLCREKEISEMEANWSTTLFPAIIYPQRLSRLRCEVTGGRNHWYAVPFSEEGPHESVIEIVVWEAVFQNICRESPSRKNLSPFLQLVFVIKVSEIEFKITSAGPLWQACWFPPGDNSQSQHVHQPPPPRTPHCHNSARILICFTQWGEGLHGGGLKTVLSYFGISRGLDLHLLVRTWGIKRRRENKNVFAGEDHMSR